MENDDNRISVDAKLWEEQKKALETFRHYAFYGTLFGITGLVWAASMTHVPKLIQLPPEIRIQRVVEYVPFTGMDPDYMAQALKDFEETHMRDGAPCKNLLGMSTEMYNQKYPLNVRVEVRRRLGLLK